MSLKGFDVVLEGYAGYPDYTMRFSYSINEQKRLSVFKATVYSMATDKIVGVANFQSDPYRKIIITETEIIKEFVNQLYTNMQ